MLWFFFEPKNENIEKMLQIGRSSCYENIKKSALIRFSSLKVFYVICPSNFEPDLLASKLIMQAFNFPADSKILRGDDISVKTIISF